jgi:hypothetical protein
MNILQDYLETNAAKGIIDFRFRATPVNGAVHIYIHPLGHHGETLDFYVLGNALIDKQLADKISADPKEAIDAMHAAMHSANAADERHSPAKENL